MPSIQEINNSRQKMFEGYCRGGPMDGKLLSHPLHFYPMGVGDIRIGRYMFAINSEWIWVDYDYRKKEGGLLE